MAKFTRSVFPGFTTTFIPCIEFLCRVGCLFSNTKSPSLRKRSTLSPISNVIFFFLGMMVGIFFGCPLLSFGRVITSPSLISILQSVTVIVLPSLMIWSPWLRYVPNLTLAAGTDMRVPFFLITTEALPGVLTSSVSLAMDRCVTCSGMVSIFAISSGTATSFNFRVGSGPTTVLAVLSQRLPIRFWRTCPVFFVMRSLMPVMGL